MYGESVYASAKELEHVDISTVDHDCGFKEGFARALYVDTSGTILKIDNSEVEGYTTLSLSAGWHAIEVKKIYKAGSTIPGAVDLAGW